jgi:electron transfer flavoprotein alpha/beta subunit
VKVLVLVRASRLDPGGEVHRSILRPAERAALRLGRSLAATTEGGTLVALCAGDAGDDVALSAARGLGATDTYRLWDPLLAEVDGLGLARALAFAARHVGFDVILAGVRSTDVAAGYCGPVVAECLDLPHLTGASELAWSPVPPDLVALRTCIGQTYEVPLRAPCVVTILPEETVEPTPLEAAGPPPKVLSLADVELSQALLIPRTRLKGVILPASTPTERTEWRATGAELLDHLRRVDLLR